MHGGLKLPVVSFYRYPVVCCLQLQPDIYRRPPPGSNREQLQRHCWGVSVWTYLAILLYRVLPRKSGALASVKVRTI